MNIIDDKHLARELTLEQDEDGWWIADHPRISVYGHGRTKDDAVKDYFISLGEYYELLSSAAQDDEPSMMLFNSLNDFLFSREIA